MSTAIIKPINNQFAIVEMGSQERTIEMDQVAEMVAVLKANDMSVEITLKANGYRISSDVEAELLEMSGLSSFQAAKATASGKLVF